MKSDIMHLYSSRQPSLYDLKVSSLFAHVSLLVGIASFALVCITGGGSLKVKLLSPAYNPQTPTHLFSSPAVLLTLLQVLFSFPQSSQRHTAIPGPPGM